MFIVKGDLAWVLHISTGLLAAMSILWMGGNGARTDILDEGSASGGLMV
jgi:hypothetical protein